VGNSGVRTGGGPPGRSLAREKDAQGGAAQATPTSPEAHSSLRSEKTSSLATSEAGGTSMSTGENLFALIRDMTLDRGAASPENKSRKNRGGGRAPAGRSEAGAEAESRSETGPEEA